jgi:excisionase family DNA binding protein
MTREALIQTLTKRRDFVSVREAVDYLEQKVDREAIIQALTRHRDMMSIKEAAAYLNVACRVIVDLVREEGMPAQKVDGRWVFNREAVDQWLEVRDPSSEPMKS